VSTVQAISFECEGDQLYGVLHVPDKLLPRGLLIVVGGPQYRVGSHRQFVLLARAASKKGIPALRFDHRGIGDSDGELRGFEDINSDIRSAIDTFFEHLQDLKEVVIWGLCDAASAALMYGYRDGRVVGQVLLNPWVRTEEGLAKAFLRHYYIANLKQLKFWMSVLKGELDLSKAACSFLQNVLTASGLKGQQKLRNESVPTEIEATKVTNNTPPFPIRMARGLTVFQGRVLIILSGEDLTASEFKDMVAASKQWQRLLKRPNVSVRELNEANHTFSRREWRDQVAQWTVDWLISW
jgi:exosortase A-associated hydrolase 1